MNTRFRRMLSFAASMLALAVGLASPPSVYAATTLVVDDDNAQCPSAGYNQISTAIGDAPLSGATIIVCEGTYDSFTVNGFTSLKIKAQDPAHRPTVTVAPGTASATIITVSSSKSVTLDGLIVDGANFTDGYEGSAQMIGIYYHNASGTIQNSRIANMRDYPITGATGWAIWLLDNDNDGKASKVTIKRNAIVEYQSTGIFVWGAVKATITGNQMDGLNGDATGPAATGISFLSSPDGIPSGKISNNLIANHNIGVSLLDVAKIGVSRNTMHTNLTSVSILSTCENLNSGTLGSSNNKITGNTFMYTDHAVDIHAEANNDGSHSVCDPQVDGNVVSGNLITSFSTVSSEAVYVHTSSSGAVTSYVPTADKNKITGNTMWGYFDPAKLIGSVTNTTISRNKIY